MPSEQQHSENQRPDDSVMKGVIPYLCLAGRAGEAADFYVKAFGALDMGRMPGDDGRLMHVQVEINGGALMMTDHQPEGFPAGPALPTGHLQLVRPDAQAWWDRALAAGCKMVMPFEMQYWGDRWGLMVDPFGIHWAILEPGPAAA